jgi:hypothetical protein
VNPVTKFESQYKTLITQKTPSGRPLHTEWNRTNEDTDEDAPRNIDLTLTLQKQIHSTASRPIVQLPAKSQQLSLN